MSQNKIIIKVEKEIDLPDEISIDDLNRLAIYVKNREEEIFTNDVSKNRIKSLKVFLQNGKEQTFLLPDSTLPEYVLSEKPGAKILYFNPGRAANENN